MVVIPFPSKLRPTPPADQEPEKVLVHIIAAIHSLGEPATLGDIGGLLLDIKVLRTQYEAAALSSILVEYSRPEPVQPFEVSLFRPVLIGGMTAWAFTSQFRRKLRAIGLTPSLRGYRPEVPNAIVPNKPGVGW